MPSTRGRGQDENQGARCGHLTGSARTWAKFRRNLRKTAFYLTIQGEKGAFFLHTDINECAKMIKKYKNNLQCQNNKVYFCSENINF
jgi:hypothetical protein